MAAAGAPGSGRDKTEGKRYFGLSGEAWAVIGSIATVIALIVTLAQVLGHHGSDGGNAGKPPSDGRSTGSAGSSPTSPRPVVTTATASPTGTAPSPVSPAQLEQILLPAQTLGPTTAVDAKSADLSQIIGICGAPLPAGAQAGVYELLQDSQTNQSLVEIIVDWSTAADASAAIAENRTAVDRSGDCTYTYSGEKTEYEGDYQASPPSSCADPGNYLDTQVFITSSSLFSPGLTSGFNSEAQCGTFTIAVQAEGAPGFGVDQGTNDGYLGNAVGLLAAAGH